MERIGINYIFRGEFWKCKLGNFFATKPLSMEDGYDHQNYSQAALKQLAYEVIGAAIEVHEHLGPGLLESVYEECLVEELKLRMHDVDRQVKVPVFYKGRRVKQDLQLDLLVDDIFIVEVKAVKHLLPVHSAQLRSYLELSAKPKGVVINFFTHNISDSAVHVLSSYFNQHPEE